MMDPLYAWVITAVVIVAAAGVVYFVEWRLYMMVRRERDECKQSLAAVVADRDGWRGVAERALLVAQIGKRVTTRATSAAQIEAASDLPK